MLKIYKVNLHSAVDLITNSSTTIYTFSDGCIGPVKELVNEMLHVMNSTETFDDIFYAGVFFDDSGDYVDKYEDYDEEYDNENNLISFPDESERNGLTQYEYIDKIIDLVLQDKIPKPNWMLEAEKNADKYDNYTNTTLYLKPKSEIYQPLADKLIKFLYSTDHEEHYS